MEDYSIISTINIPGYNFIYKCRNTGAGGGVGLFVKDEYQLQVQPVSDDSNVETVFVEILCKNNNKKYYCWFDLPATWYQSWTF